MGGKGRRRREKNFLAAHGGDARLPPPPKLKELDALPSKLRKILVLKNNPQKPQASPQIPTAKNKRKRDNPDDDADGKRSKKANPKDAQSSAEFKLEKGDKDRETTSVTDLVAKDANTSDKRKKKRSRKTVDDLRFQGSDQAPANSNRKERKKEYFESKKKKHKKEKTNDIRDFPGREEIRFGEIVEAPPKLSFPKKSKAFMDASKERARLQAVEAYRNRKGWASRPGLQLPLLAESPSL